MRSALAVVLAVSFFISTLDAQTFAQTGAQSTPRAAQAAVNLNGLWEIVDKDAVAVDENAGGKPWPLNGDGRERKTIKVAVDAPWTDTGLKLVEGQPFSVVATGEMNWFTGGCPDTAANCTVTPEGRPWSVCAGFGGGFIARELNCWSLIGRIDDGPVFEVGSSLDNFSVKSSGELYLGVNDAAGGFGDNTGQWNAQITLNAGVKHFLIASAAHGFTMCVTDDGKTCLTHTTLAGSFGSDPSRLRLVATFTSKSPEVYLTVLDPDHINGPRGIYIRAAAGAYDVPCDARNSAHVTGDFAVQRARDAIRNYKKDELTACWMRIAAESGNARAQALMASFAYDGKGVPKNVPEAADWAQKSADQKDALGEIMLGLMYENHEVKLQNASLGQALIDRAYLQLNQIRHEQGQPPILQKSQQQAQNRQAAGALLGLLIIGTMMAGSSGSHGTGEEAFQAEQNRGYQMDKNNEEACDRGAAWACAATSRPAPEQE